MVWFLWKGGMRKRKTATWEKLCKAVPQVCSVCKLNVNCVCEPELACEWETGPKNFCKEWSGWFYTMVYCCCWWLHVSLALHTALGRTISCVWKPELCLRFAYFVFEYILGVHKTKFKESNFSFFICTCWSWNINLFSLFKWLTGKR